MILRGTPKNHKDFIKVDRDTTIVLSTNGFDAMYIDENYCYYIKSDELLEFMLERGLHYEL